MTQIWKEKAEKINNNDIEIISDSKNSSFVVSLYSVIPPQVCFIIIILAHIINNIFSLNLKQ